MRSTKRTPKQLKAFLEKRGINYADCVAAFGESATKNPFVKAARKRASEGDLEIDDVAVVSDGGDPGAYVSCWLWVSFSDADIGSASMDDLCAFLIPRLTENDIDRRPLFARFEWLQDLIMNFEEAIDDIDNVVVRHDAPTCVINWTTSDQTYQFSPSSAITDLVAEARRLGVSECVAKAVEIYLERYGDALDQPNTALSTPAEVDHAH